MRANKIHSCYDLLQFIGEANWDASLDVSLDNLDLCVTYKTQENGRGLYGTDHPILVDVEPTQNMIQYVCKTLNGSIPRNQDSSIEREFEESVFRPHKKTELTTQQ